MENNEIDPNVLEDTITFVIESKPIPCRSLWKYANTITFTNRVVHEVQRTISVIYTCVEGIIRSIVMNQD